MRPPRVSVCVTTYNQEALIEQCLRSIAEQRVDGSMEILVGDDSSTDSTGVIVAHVAAQYPHVMQHLRRNPRMGPFANMRDLMGRADGDFIARVDGDDYWLPGKLQRQVAFLQAHPDCAAVYTNAITVNEDGDRIGLFNDVGSANFDLPAMLRRGNFLNNSSILFRRAGLGAYLSIDAPQIDYRAHLWHARHGWLGHIGEPLTAYRVNAHGSMVANMNERVRELYWEAIQSVPRELVTDDDYAHGIADFLRRVTFRAVRTGDIDLLRRWIHLALAASPYRPTRTLGLTVAAIARMAWRIGYGKMRGGPYGRGSHVLYRR